MIENLYEPYFFPIVMNRSIVNLYHKQIFIDWLKYIREEDFSKTQKHIEPISFLINDFEYQSDYDNWLIKNFSKLFEIRLSYSCVDKTLWPEIRTFDVFNQWFEVRHSNLIIDLGEGPVETI